jgi:uncharacterized membrane protein YbhN (UPF0104 family)
MSTTSTPPEELLSCGSISWSSGFSLCGSLKAVLQRSLKAVLPHQIARALKFAVAVLLLATIYWAADWRAVGRAATTLEPVLLAAALLMFVPQTLVSAARWRWLVRPLCHLSLASGVRQTLAASALNLVVPSKLGDLSKAAMLPLDGPAKRRAALLAVYEKAADLSMLGLLCGLGWLGLEERPLLVCVFVVSLAMAAGVAAVGKHRSLVYWIALAAWTLGLWLLHLMQIGLFLWAAGVPAGLDQLLARVPLAIIAGLLPVSFCGLGTRDAALIYLFADIAPPSTMAVVGMLTALRYIVPGAAGIPFLSRMRWQWRAGDRRAGGVSPLIAVETSAGSGS